MATSPHPPTPGPEASRVVLDKARKVSILVLSAVLAVCFFFAWTTRDSMQHLPFLPGLNKGRPNPIHPELVDTSPWLTAQALAPLAVSAEETEFARDAERLADHDVDQAFASALRSANLDAQHRVLAGRALEISNRITQLHQLIQQDQALVDSLTAKAGAKQAAPVAGADLDVAKAQLSLDTDELSDAQRDLARVSGDKSVEIQAELAEHEASMKQYDESVKTAAPPAAVVSLGQRGTLSARISAWLSQRERSQLLQQAIRQTQNDIAALTKQHNTLEASVDAASTPGALQGKSSADMMSSLRDRSAERQILSMFDDRIQTSQQLVNVYSRWYSQVQLQHRIVLHLILQSLALIVFIALSMVLLDALVRHFMSRPSLDHRQMHTLRSILEVGTQVFGVVLILFVLFGVPRQTTTMIGLATAGITIVMQDFILAFFGWFVLIGKNGIHVGDWVQINGIGGEVIDVGLMSTTMLETLADKGFPTGRRTSFMNGYAIRGQYFNFSTAGQWMWDEITVSIPATDDLHAKVDHILKVVTEETQQNVHQAEIEWRQGTRGHGISRIAATPVVNMHPTSSGVDASVRYVTRASERFEVRNRLNQQIIEVLHEQPGEASKTSPLPVKPPA
jgi:small-conductance mechanosensitive channel